MSEHHGSDDAQVSLNADGHHGQDGAVHVCVEDQGQETVGGYKEEEHAPLSQDDNFMFIILKISFSYVDDKFETEQVVQVDIFRIIHTHTHILKTTKEDVAMPHITNMYQSKIQVC